MAMVMAVPSQAQAKFGIKAGLNLSKLSTKVADLKDNSTGFFIGPMAEFTVPIVGLGIDGALMYSQRGSDELKQQGLEVPINLKYTVGLGSTAGLFFAVGPDFFLNFKDLDTHFKEAYDNKKFQCGLNLGIGLKLLSHIQVGVNYQLPLGDTFSAKSIGSAVTSGDMKYKTWQLSLAYMF